MLNLSLNLDESTLHALVAKLIRAVELLENTLNGGLVKHEDPESEVDKSIDEDDMMVSEVSSPCLEENVHENIFAEFNNTHCNEGFIEIDVNPKALSSPDTSDQIQLVDGWKIDEPPWASNMLT